MGPYEGFTIRVTKKFCQAAHTAPFDLAGFQKSAHRGYQTTSQMFASSSYGTIIHSTCYTDHNDENGMTQITECPTIMTWREDGRTES